MKWKRNRFQPKVNTQLCCTQLETRIASRTHSHGHRHKHALASGYYWFGVIGNVPMHNTQSEHERLACRADPECRTMRLEIELQIYILHKCMVAVHRAPQHNIINVVNSNRRKGEMSNFPFRSAEHGDIDGERPSSIYSHPLKWVHVCVPYEPLIWYFPFRDLSRANFRSFITEFSFIPVARARALVCVYALCTSPTCAGRARKPNRNFYFSILSVYGSAGEKMLTISIGRMRELFATNCEHIFVLPINCLAARPRNAVRFRRITA